LEEDYSDEFLEQCRTRAHGGRDITMNCITYLMSKILLNGISWAGHIILWKIVGKSRCLVLDRKAQGQLEGPD
jgi:hypothetical protein